MRKDRIEALALFAAALAVRLLLFYPSFIQGGDLGQFATFAREIHAAGGIPAVNTLYFPGTAYIYPPLIFLIADVINSPFFSSFNPAVVMQELFLIAAIASSAIAVLIYRMARSEDEITKNVVIGLIAVFFMPDLYALSWGGDPFILGEFLFIVSLYFLSKREAGKNLWILFSSVSLLLLALSHDLTWFFSMFSFIALLVYDTYRKNYSIVLKELVPFASSLAVGLIWWVPRARFVYDAFFVTESSGYGLYVPLSTAGSYILVFVPFAISVVAVAFYSLYRSNIRLSSVKWDPFIVSLVASLVFILFILKSQTLGGRIMYFSIILGTIVVLRFFRDTTGPQLRPRRTRLNSGPAKFQLALAVLAVVLLTVPVQVSFAAQSVSHYKSGYYQYDATLLAWGQTHFVNGTVVAPNVGNYISSVDGAPVIVYGNFLVGNAQIEYRNAAAYIVLNPGSQTSINYIHQYGIRYIVVTSAFMNSVQETNYFPAGMYKQVFSDQHYYVEEYIGN